MSELPWGDDSASDRTIAKRKEARTRVGAAVVAWGDAVDHVEALYRESNGEITDEIAAAEAWSELAEKDAAESLARFERYCVLTVDAIKAERARLDAAEERMQSRLTWCRARLLEVLGDRTSLSVGPYRITSRKSSHVEADADLDVELLAQTHPECVRWSDPVPAKAKLDKAAAKAVLVDGLPPAGIRLVTTRKVAVK